MVSPGSQTWPAIVAIVLVSIATSSKRTGSPLASARLSVTPCASASGRPSIAREVAAGSSLPHTV